MIYGTDKPDLRINLLPFRMQPHVLADCGFGPFEGADGKSNRGSLSFKGTRKVIDKTDVLM